MPNAPVALFAYRRPHHFRLTIEALQRCSGATDTELHIFLDGAKSAEDRLDVQEVEQVAMSATGFGSVSIHRSSANKGLSASITGGVDTLIAQYGRVIVVEDDLVVSPFFLEYMNSHLDLYLDDPIVASIHAYMHPHPDVELPETFFIRGASPWGWATWDRAWKTFERDGNVLVDELVSRRLTTEFDFGGAVPFTQLLRDQTTGSNESWDSCWRASCFLKGMLTLYPSRSLATNIGQDGSGTHGGVIEVTQAVTDRPVVARRIPLEESQAAVDAFRDAYLARNPLRRSRVGRSIEPLARWIWRRLPMGLRVVTASRISRTH